MTNCTCGQKRKFLALSLRITQEMDDFLTITALGQGISKSNYIRALLEREMKGNTTEIVCTMTDEQAARMTRIAAMYTNGIGANND